jgi:hypothetical protein
LRPRERRRTTLAPALRDETRAAVYQAIVAAADAERRRDVRDRGPS